MCHFIPINFSCALDIAEEEDFYFLSDHYVAQMVLMGGQVDYGQSSGQLVLKSQMTMTVLAWGGLAQTTGVGTAR